METKVREFEAKIMGLKFVAVVALIVAVIGCVAAVVNGAIAVSALSASRQAQAQTEATSREIQELNREIKVLLNPKPADGRFDFEAKRVPETNKAKK